MQVRRNHGSTGPRMKYFGGTCRSSEALCTATWRAAAFQLHCDLRVFKEECHALFGTFEGVNVFQSDGIQNDSQAKTEHEVLHSRMSIVSHRRMTEGTHQGK